LPESLGGSRNWDYRFCWLRDATFTLQALLEAGFREEARAWRDWLLRALAGDPEDLQIMYGPAGERRVDERTIDWLPGYEKSRPVRIGNAAVAQLQLDVYGEVLDAFHQARRMGLDENPWDWPIQRTLCDWLESNWQEPDVGLWEMRERREQFTHSKIMAWVAFDRAVKSIDQYGYKGPRERWDQLRGRIGAEIIAKGYDEERNSFVQYYGGGDLDASLLLIPQLGFLPPEDPRVIGTIEAIERELVVDGLVMRYPSRSGTDGLPAGEGAFLVCSFWLANSLALIGRHQEAVALFERLLALRNDLGLLAEEYDPQAKRFLGNFPQAFSHIGVINTAAHLAQVEPASADRGADKAAEPKTAAPQTSPAMRAG
jgi:GH15 family glucan-1,4-alpha-glucosidase